MSKMSISEAAKILEMCSHDFTEKYVKPGKIKTELNKRNVPYINKKDFIAFILKSFSSKHGKIVDLSEVQKDISDKDRVIDSLEITLKLLQDQLTRERINNIETKNDIKQKQLDSSINAAMDCLRRANGKWRKGADFIDDIGVLHGIYLALDIFGMHSQASLVKKLELELCEMKKIKPMAIVTDNGKE